MSQTKQFPLPDEGMEQGDAYDPAVLENHDDFSKKGNLKELHSADEVDKNEHSRHGIHRED